MGSRIDSLFGLSVDTKTQNFDNITRNSSALKLKMIRSIKFKNLILLVLLCSPLTSLAEQIFDSATGELSWNISEEIRLQYVPSCRLNDYRDPEINSEFHNLFLALDIFSVFTYPDYERYVVCKDRGLRVIYRLREDGLAPSFSEKKVRVNGDLLWIPKQSERLTGYGDFENFQKIFAAMQTQSPVTVTISDDAFQFRISESVSRDIDISNIELAETIHLQNLESIAQTLNDQLGAKYKFILLYDILCIMLIIAFILVYWHKVHPRIFSGFVFVFKKAKQPFSMFPTRRRSGIIKRDERHSYSVADELLKWSKLKEEGIISEQQYIDAKKKILDE